MTEGPLGGTEGLSEARQAFEAVMDAESPTRSRETKDKPREERVGLNDLFPRRQLDRSEPEGGRDDDVPEVVKRARAEARQGNRNFGEEDSPGPRDPIEGNDEGEEEDDSTGLPDDEPPLDEEDEDDAQQQRAGDIDLDQVVEVTVDGQPVQVSLKEALGGYIRTETFHRRLGELSQGAQALHQQRGEMANYQQMFVERAAALEEYVKAFMPKEPDWDSLYAQNPGAAAQYERKWRTFVQQVEALSGARETTQRELTASNAASLQNYVAVNRTNMFRAHPEWREEKVWKRDHESMRRTARSVGYADAEIDQLYDARGVEILHKAAKYDRLMAAKPRPVRNGFNSAPTKRNGATPQSRNVSRSLDRAEKRLSRTGSITAAADVFERILDNER